MELLRTPRLLLRHWEESDLPAFYDLYSRDDVMRWLGSHPRRTLATLDEARERLDRWHARERDLDPPLGLWAIVPLVSGTPSPPPVGTVPLLPLSDAGGPTGLTEVGWHLHPQHQGQGLATEAAVRSLAAGVVDRIHCLPDRRGRAILRRRADRRPRAGLRPPAAGQARRLGRSQPG